jgi:hypothetical protein
MARFEEPIRQRRNGHIVNEIASQAVSVGGQAACDVTRFRAPAAWYSARNRRSPPNGLCEAVWTASGGNPLYVTELLRALALNDRHLAETDHAELLAGGLEGPSGLRTSE